MSDNKVFNGKIKGTISFNDLEFTEIYTEEVKPVSKGSKTGRVYLRDGLIGKEVYILVKK